MLTYSLPPSTRGTDWKVRCLDQVDSTQSEARRLIDAGEEHETVIVAGQQSAGHGRLLRRWFSPPGNLYMSFVLTPPLPLPGWPQLTSLAALSIAEVLDALQVPEVTLKWPNDVLVGGRKIAGVLAEACAGRLIIGIGVNVNAPLQADLFGATSLKLVTGRDTELSSLWQSIVERLDVLLAERYDGRSLTARWAARLQTLGRPVDVQYGNRIVSGVAEGVTEDGGLVVRKTGGCIEVFRAADVTLNPGPV